MSFRAFFDSLDGDFDSARSSSSIGNRRRLRPTNRLPTTRRMYSPGSLNVAVVSAFPRTRLPDGAVKSAFLRRRVAVRKVTAPGPRYLLHVTVTGGAGSGAARLAARWRHPRPTWSAASGVAAGLSTCVVTTTARALHEGTAFARNRRRAACFPWRPEGRQFPQRIQTGRDRRGDAIGGERPGELLRSEIFGHCYGEHAPLAAAEGNEWAGPDPVRRARCDCSGRRGYPDPASDCDCSSRRGC